MRSCMWKRERPDDRCRWLRRAVVAGEHRHGFTNDVFRAIEHFKGGNMYRRASKFAVADY